MSIVLDTLKERRRELFAYVRLLNHVEARLGPKGRVRRRVGDLPTPDSFKVMKATAFLMLYNVIEAIIVNIMVELYGSIERSKCALADVSDEIREIWIDQQFWIAPHEATPRTYRGRAANMLRDAMAGQPLLLKPGHLLLSGNVDAEIVRKLCRKHGWSWKAPRRSKGGAELGTVKSQRNALAHGEKSFIECGQDYAVSDIYRIARECFIFLGAFVRSAEKFVSRSGYVRAKIQTFT